MSPNPEFELSVSGAVLCISSSFDGEEIAIGDRNGNLILAGRDGTKKWEKKVDEGIHGLAMIQSNNKIVCGGKDCKLRMYNSLGNIEWEQSIGKSIWSLDVDTNGKFIAIGTGDSIGLFTKSGVQIWEFTTNRAMVGVGISRNGSTIVGCGDEQLFCLDSDGNLLWKKQRSDSLWDASVDLNGENVFVGGWDCKLQCLNKEGDDLWEFETGGYVRSVITLTNGNILAGSHDGNMYYLSNKGELIEKFGTEGEITCIGASQNLNLAVSGSGNQIIGFSIDKNIEPKQQNVEINTAVNPTDINKTETKEENQFEPMFGAGMFDEPIPDTTGLLNSRESETDYTGPSTINNDYFPENSNNEGGEYREFAAEVVKGDVTNYLRLGNAAWLEKKLDRALQHYKRATEIDANEPRAWHNLAICNYHLALKRNPEDIEGAIQCAMGPLEIAKEKGGTDYSSADDTVAYFASQLGIVKE
jgi:hypothetical protein